MKLRKIATLITSLMLGASLVACGGSNTESATTTETATTDADSKVYHIATDTAFAPFEYAEANGTYVGIDIELMAAIAEDQNFQYSIDPVGFDAALQNVQVGQADGIIAGMSITEERQKSFDFSDPYYDSTVCVAVATDGDVNSLDGLKGQNVAVKNGTMSQAWAENIKDQYGFTTTVFDTSDVMYQDVLAGNSIACFEDTPAMSYAIDSQSMGLKIIEEVDSSSEFATPYGFAVNKGQNAELLQKFNDGLKNIKANGTYDAIIAKYVKTVK